LAEFFLARDPYLGISRFGFPFSAESAASPLFIRAKSTLPRQSKASNVRRTCDLRHFIPNWKNLSLTLVCSNLGPTCPRSHHVSFRFEIGGFGSQLDGNPVPGSRCQRFPAWFDD
jgi:hypothetical protein